MTLFIFLGAVLVSVVFRHQERRHAAQLNAECHRLGLPAVDRRPAVQTLESVLTILLGITMCLPSGYVLAEAFASGNPQDWKPLWEIVTAGLALGLALLVVGTRALVTRR